MYLIVLRYGISAPLAIASVISVMMMVAAIIRHCDRGGPDEDFPEI